MHMRIIMIMIDADDDDDDDDDDDKFMWNEINKQKIKTKMGTSYEA